MHRISDYDFKVHLHRYAVWTAARAAQRNYKSTEEIRQMIEEINLHNEVLALINHLNDGEDYFNWHKRMCDAIMKLAVDELFFGRASKIISIYLKTSAVIPSGGESIISLHAYPPVDRILLKEANEALKRKNEQPIKEIGWTTWNEEQYKTAIDKLRILKGGEPWWKVEYLWQPVQRFKTVMS